MPRYWYVFNGPQTASGYTTLSNYIYYNTASTGFVPLCTSGANVCAIYSIGSAANKTLSNPTTISENQQDRILSAKANGANQLGPFGAVYVRVRTTP